MGLDTAGARHAVFRDLMSEVTTKTLQEKINQAHQCRPYSEEAVSFYHDGTLVEVWPDGRAYEKNVYGTCLKSIGTANALAKNKDQV